MGAGWWQTNGASGAASLLPMDPRSARRAAIASALCGAIGMWISAASVLPAIAITGVSGLAMTVWRGNSATRCGARFDPATWRLWGRVGAAASAIFYLLEYAPAHLGIRLEVNHP